MRVEHKNYLNYEMFINQFYDPAIAIMGDNITGFIFEQADPNALAVTIRRALSHYQYKLGWEETQIRGMKQDFSWHKSALKYAGIYQGLKRGRNEN